MADPYLPQPGNRTMSSKSFLVSGNTKTTEVSTQDLADTVQSSQSINFSSSIWNGLPSDDTTINNNSNLIDARSVLGHFGWASFENVYIPYIFRREQKFCAVRMVEINLLNKYSRYLTNDVIDCACIESYYVTQSESRLLNEINQKHCDNHFGNEFFSQCDLIVLLTDVQNFHQFLNFIYKRIFNYNDIPEGLCSFIYINDMSMVPYTISNGSKVLPQFYFEYKTVPSTLKSELLQGIELCYLKFCCKLSGIKNELFAGKTMIVVKLDDLKEIFPRGSTFEDHWPRNVSFSKLFNNSNAENQPFGNWLRQPSCSPSSNFTCQQQSTYFNQTQIQTKNTSLTASELAGPPLLIYPLLILTDQQPQPANECASFTLTNEKQIAPMSVIPTTETKTVQMESNSLSSDILPVCDLTPIPDIRTPDGNVLPPYKIHNTLVDKRVVLCINMKPYVQAELLMTVHDLNTIFFPTYNLQSCRRVLHELDIELYKGNKMQMQVLSEKAKCTSKSENHPLIRLRDVTRFMSQIRISLISKETGSAIKRART